MRRGTRRRISGVAAASWLLATAVTSLVVWRASATFTDVSSTRVLTAPQVSQRLGAASAASSASTGPSLSRRTQVPSRTQTATATATGGRPTMEPSATATPVSSTSLGTSPSAAESTTAARVVKTWTMSGGSLSVACEGEALSLVYASPRDGWRVEAERPVNAVDVIFERVGEGIEVRVVCTGGVPQQITKLTQGDR